MQTAYLRRGCIIISSHCQRFRAAKCTGNYYVEARTRNQERTDLIIDYLGTQYIIEMKIWHGNAYNERGEKQLVEYLDHYHLQKGYMLSFSFNKTKRTGLREIRLGGKILIEAVV